MQSSGEWSRLYTLSPKKACKAEDLGMDKNSKEAEGTLSLFQ